MNESRKYNSCIENISIKFDKPKQEIKKFIDKKYKEDKIFRIQTQMKIVMKR